MGEVQENGERQTPSPNANGAAAGLVNRRAAQRAIAVGALPSVGEGDPLAELKELLKTAGVATAGAMVQQRDTPDPVAYLGKGKIAELKAEIKRTNANLVATDDELEPRQERNLEKELGVPVIDRTAVILDIFADHAHSAEGKLQVELAQLEYNLARMRGLWTHLERLGAGSVGGIGTRGPGESQIETDRRLARDRITALRRKLKKLEGSRATMRSERAKAALPTIALAGYTNAGKSSLMNALTGSEEVDVGSRLFHTLDPTTRVLEFDHRRMLLTDTVGFISKLPHALVEAFKATLEETVLADLILHVVDGSDPEEQMTEAIASANSALEEIGAGAKPRVLALNKADLIAEEDRRELLLRYPEAVLVSAETGEGLDELASLLAETVTGGLREVELLVPYEDGARLSELHRVAGDLEREDRAEGVFVRARLPGEVAERYADLVRSSGG
jgi:GTP-binding protein HflX